MNEVATPKSDLIFGRQPAIWIALVQLLVGGVTLFIGEDVLSQDNATLIVAAVNALLGLIVVWKVAEAAFPALGALVNGVVALTIGFGLDLTKDQQGWIQMAVPLVVAIFLWPALHPTLPPPPAVVASMPNRPPANP